jgi:hypothetical protein
MKNIRSLLACRGSDRLLDRGRAYEINLLPGRTKAVAPSGGGQFPKSDLLASGWISGESTVGEKHVCWRYATVRSRDPVWFRPQFRGQTFGTFKFLLNAIYLASAKALNE